MQDDIGVEEVLCVCGSEADLGLMIQCDKCEMWSHNKVL